VLSFLVHAVQEFNPFAAGALHPEDIGPPTQPFHHVARNRCGCAAIYSGSVEDVKRL
jgi:hypothetical protein